MDYTYYGEYTDAVEYFGYRMHSEAWDGATATERTNALIEATRIVDALSYKGYKAAEYSVLFDAEGNELFPTDAAMRTANLSQAHEFPRGTDTSVPDDICLATWEIAYALLDGVDPDLELENLAAIGQGIASARTTYDRDVRMEHFENGVPSAKAWKYLKPYLRDAHIIKTRRV